MPKKTVSKDAKYGETIRDGVVNIGTRKEMVSPELVVKEIQKLTDEMKTMREMKADLEHWLLVYMEDQDGDEVYLDRFRVSRVRDRVVDPLLFRQHFGEGRLPVDIYQECHTDAYEKVEQFPARVNLTKVNKYIVRQGGEMAEDLKKCTLYGDYRVKISERISK